jgi:hypothetical protein
VGAYVAGRTSQPSLDRAARWDGLLPQLLGDERTKVDRPDALATVLGAVMERREALGLAQAPYDVVIEADSTGDFITLEPDDPATWEDAGATWWIESWWTVDPGPEGLAEVRRRVEAGPPR